MRVIVLAVLFACACGAAAAPQRRVAVLGVERSSGAPDEAFQAWLERRVDTHFEVVRSAPPEDGVDSLDEDAIREVASRLDVEAVVYGELSKKKRGKMRLTVRVHDGHTGALIETHELAIKAGKAIATQEKRFARELLAMLPPPRKPTKSIAKAKPVKSRKKKHDEPPPDSESTDDAAADDEPAEVASDDEEERDRERPAEPAFIPAKTLKSVELNRNGQASDDEMPTLFVKK